VRVKTAVPTLLVFAATGSRVGWPDHEGVCRRLHLVVGVAAIVRSGSGGASIGPPDCGAREDAPEHAGCHDRAQPRLAALPEVATESSLGAALSFARPEERAEGDRACWNERSRTGSRQGAKAARERPGPVEDELGGEPCESGEKLFPAGKKTGENCACALSPRRYRPA
jgi:hypothetical protein